MYFHETEQGVRYRIYTDVLEWAETLPKWFSRFTMRYKKWCRIPAGFDIETTRIDREAFMYHWQFSFGDQIILGRYWCDYDNLVDILQTWLHRWKVHLIVWVANLGHEFAFLCNRYDWGNVFAREAHQPITAEQGNIQYRECLTLSGQGGLKNLAKNYTLTKKAVGDLDYSKIRNAETPMTDTEIGYCINDVAILSEWGEYVFQRWVDGKSPVKIPLTATGICRDAMRTAAGDQLDKIKKQIYLDYPKSAAEYNFIMQYLFRGGYTHANVWWAGDPLDGSDWIPDVIGADFTSSYPAVMLHPDCYYPVGGFFRIHLNVKDGRICDQKADRLTWWMLCDITNIRSKSFHHIESVHKIIMADNLARDNGRMVAASKIRVALTDIDYKVYSMFYDWDDITVIRAFGSRRGQLPAYVRQPLIDAYKAKCELKMQHLDHTPEYKNAKSMVNSYYGCTVQRLNFTDWNWSKEAGWTESPSKKGYDKMRSEQVLLPWWGIWVTAWARHRLLTAVHQLDPDEDHNNVIYCDTDSIYMIGSPDNIRAVTDYNALIQPQNDGLPAVCSDLGTFDWIDGRTTYRFRTLGAKRYIKMDADGNPTVTVAGLKYGSYEESICTEEPPDGEHFRIQTEDADGTKHDRFVSVEDFFHFFRPDLMIDMYVSHKTTCLYRKTAYSAEVDGQIMHEMGGCCIYPIPYKLRMDQVYIDLIQQIHERRRKPILW